MSKDADRKDSDRPDDPAALKQRVAQLERENRRLRERCEEAELEIARLERGLSSMEQTLSFRLGHALIQSTKSWNGLRALPLVLSELRRDNRRKKPAEDQRSVVEAALRASAGYAKQGGELAGRLRGQAAGDNGERRDAEQAARKPKKGA